MFQIKTTWKKKVKKLGDNIVTLWSKKLPEVHTECRGFWERKEGQGDNEKKSMGKTLWYFFCFVLFCFVFLLISMVLHQSSRNICMWLIVQTCTFAHHHLRCRQWKGLNNQHFKNSISKTQQLIKLNEHILRSIPSLFFLQFWFFCFSSQQYSCNYNL